MRWSASSIRSSLSLDSELPLWTKKDTSHTKKKMCKNSDCQFSGRHLRRGQKGGGSVGKTKRGKGTKLVALAGSSGLPLAVHAASASPHEVTLVEATLAASFLGEEPERLIGDRAYDSDPLNAALQERGIEMIAPHRRNRRNPRLRTNASSGPTRGAGRSSVSSPSSGTFRGWWCATSGGWRTTSASSDWAASSYY
jgi:IS5 family transposase